MKAESKLLDDIARVAGGAVTILSSLREQVRADLRERIDMASDRMDFVPRDDVERLKLMLEKSRQEQEDLKKRIAFLEQKLNVKTTAPVAKKESKAVPKKAVKNKNSSKAKKPKKK